MIMNNMPNWTDNFAIDYENIVNNNFDFFKEMLQQNPRLIFHVDDNCFNFLISKFDFEIRYGISHDWNILFYISKDTFIKYHKLFQSELKLHFIKRPGLWFYIFRYDVMKKNARGQQVDNALFQMRECMNNWNIND